MEQTAAKRKNTDILKNFMNLEHIETLIRYRVEELSEKIGYN